MSHRIRMGDKICLIFSSSFFIFTIAFIALDIPYRETQIADLDLSHNVETLYVILMLFQR